MATRSLAGRILVSIGDGDTQEVATFSVPIIARLDMSSATVHLEGGDVRGELAAALRETADRLDLISVEHANERESANWPRPSV